MILLSKKDVHTALTQPRIKNLHDCVKQIHKNNIPGVIVECGVYTGGCIIICKKALDSVNDFREYYCYDTFDGMTAPDDNDDEKALRLYKERGSNWCRSPIEEVKQNFIKQNILDDRVKFIVGDVHETLLIEDNIPEKIAMLRLDTDWYSSTKIELEKLYHKVVSGGYIIIDDYYKWSGQKKAIDEFFNGMDITLEFKNLDGEGINPTVYFMKD